MKFTVFIEIDVETHDQPPTDVRSRLSNVKGRVGQNIAKAAHEAAVEAIFVGWPEGRFPNWPENGEGAEVVGVRQHTRRSDR